MQRLCLFRDELPDCLWLFFALFCSCWARSWFSSPGGSSCSECFFLFNEDCSTLILERATTNESFISASSWVSWNSGDDDNKAKPRFRRQPMMGLGGGAHGNGDSLPAGGVCRNPAIPCRLSFNLENTCNPLVVKDDDLLSYSVIRAVFRRAVFLLPSTVKLTYTYHPLAHIIEANLFTFNSWRYY